jgi:hypothetical protein
VLVLPIDSAANEGRAWDAKRRSSDRPPMRCSSHGGPDTGVVRFGKPHYNSRHVVSASVPDDGRSSRTRKDAFGFRT